MTEMSANTQLIHTPRSQISEPSTVREILYFTIYYNLRHASQESD
jgi:hypothetical protein